MNQKYRFFSKLISLFISLNLFVSNLALSDTEDKLAARSRIQSFFSKNGIELSTPQEMALSIAMGQLQKTILEEGESNISGEIQQLNETLSKAGLKITKTKLEFDEETKIPYVTISIFSSRINIRVYFLQEDQREVNNKLMIEEKDLRHFECPGLEGVWFVNEERILLDRYGLSEGERFWKFKRISGERLQPLRDKCNALKELLSSRERQGISLQEADAQIVQLAKEIKSLEETIGYRVTRRIIGSPLVILDLRKRTCLADYYPGFAESELLERPLPPNHFFRAVMDIRAEGGLRDLTDYNGTSEEDVVRLLKAFGFDKSDLSNIASIKDVATKKLRYLTYLEPLLIRSGDMPAQVCAMFRQIIGTYIYDTGGKLTPWGIYDWNWVIVPIEEFIAKLKEVARQGERGIAKKLMPSPDPEINQDGIRLAESKLIPIRILQHCDEAKRFREIFPGGQFEPYITIQTFDGIWEVGTVLPGSTDEFLHLKLKDSDVIEIIPAGNIKVLISGDRKPGDGSIIQGTESIKEFSKNRKVGKYQLLSVEFLNEAKRVARENNISLEGISIYAIQSIVKAKNDFVHGYFDRATNELFLSINIMQQAKAYDDRKDTKLLDEYIEHELRCNGENHQELRREQRAKYHRYGNYADIDKDEGRLRDIVREDTDMRAIANQYIETVKSTKEIAQGQKVVLALDTDIGNISNNPELLKQLGEVAGLWGNIDFIAESGKTSLGQQIDTKVRQLKALGTVSENIKVIVVTNKKGQFTKYKVTQIDDNEISNYVPILEILTFTLTLHLEEDNESRNIKLKTLYKLITGKELQDGDLDKIALGALALAIPQVEKISVEIYKGAIEVLTAA